MIEICGVELINGNWVAILEHENIVICDECECKDADEACDMFMELHTAKSGWDDQDNQY